MLLNYRQIMRDASGLEYSIIRGGGQELLCIQGVIAKEGRIKRAFSSALFFQSTIPDYFPKPVSCSSDQNLSSALFENIDGGLLKSFLSVVTPPAQYAQGRRTGRVLKLMHELPLDGKAEKKAQKRQSGFMEKLAEYISKLPRFKGEKAALDALSERFDNFNLWRGVMRYGQLRHDRLLVTPQATPVFLPSSAYGPGDACEDFALLETVSAGLYPVFCAGVIDGYFAGVVPADFWVQFAMYSALYSLWRCGRTAKGGKKSYALMQLQYDRIRDDFDDFKKPVPGWYLSEEVTQARNIAVKKGL